MANRMRPRQVYAVVKVKMVTLWGMENVTHHITLRHEGKVTLTTHSVLTNSLVMRLMVLSN